MDRFVAEQVGRGLKPPTVNRRLAAITSFYTFLADEDPELVCPVLPRRHGLKERQRLPRPVRKRTWTSSSPSSTTAATGPCSS